MTSMRRTRTLLQQLILQTEPTSSNDDSRFPVGARGEASTTVSDQKGNTANRMGSGSLPVYSTPSMVALMEEASCSALKYFLTPAETTVGTGIATSHLAATALGASVTATATLTKAQGKSLSFEVEATDSTGLTIGKGTHTRAVVDSSRFMGKLAKRSST